MSTSLKNGMIVRFNQFPYDFVIVKVYYNDYKICVSNYSDKINHDDIVLFISQYGYLIFSKDLESIDLFPLDIQQKDPHFIVTKIAGKLIKSENALFNICIDDENKYALKSHPEKKIISNYFYKNDTINDLSLIQKYQRRKGNDLIWFSMIFLFFLFFFTIYVILLK